MNKRILLLIVLLFSFPLITICQQSNSIIKVDQKSIDLSKIDLDKGEIVKETSYSVGSDSNKIERYYIQIKVFKNSTLNNYAVVYDTAIYSYDGYSSSYIQYFTSNGTLLFEKSFDGFEVFQPCISLSGDLLVVDLTNIDANFGSIPQSV